MSEVVDTTLITDPNSSYFGIDNTVEKTTLQYQGGYYGQPLISTAGGYGGVATVNAMYQPTMLAQVGNWIQNNLLISGVIGVGVIALLKSRKR